ncbi:hypothetical protein LTR37_000613 [Vermiconidia calcicola]|uniref:Uncharacterized protein n=1 Tax=Vermiconidia calcicola TaxID=1690605 RepID=A0ACC3NYP1_9PEZI|nr:hypothetical protein LTR37_000613 [Vermiconidia calcicola]
MPQYFSDIYGYEPSLVAAVVFAGIFGALSLLHTYQAARSKTWFFIAFVIGGYFEFFCYVVRAVSIQQAPDYTLIPFAASLALILIAPGLFAASIYMFLGRIVRLIQADHHSIIRLTWLTKILIVGDVISFVVQGVGAVIVTQQTADAFKLGSNVIIIGLAVQLAFFGLFVSTAVLFHWRTNQQPTDRSRNPAIPWKQHLRILYAASAIIMVRCFYRFIEYKTQGSSGGGYLVSHEWSAFVFDAALMVLVMVIFFVRHPSEINALRPARGGIAMNYVIGHPVERVNDRWRTLPPPSLNSSKMMYESGNKMARMSVHPPRAVILRR